MTGQLRSCWVTRRRQSKDTLLPVFAHDGQLRVGRALAGRGAWIECSATVIAQARRSKRGFPLGNAAIAPDFEVEARAWVEHDLSALFLRARRSGLVRLGPGLGVDVPPEPAGMLVARLATLPAALGRAESTIPWARSSRDPTALGAFFGTSAVDWASVTRSRLGTGIALQLLRLRNLG